MISSTTTCLEIGINIIQQQKELEKYKLHEKTGLCSKKNVGAMKKKVRAMKNRPLFNVDAFKIDYWRSSLR